VGQLFFFSFGYLSFLALQINVTIANENIIAMQTFPDSLLHLVMIQDHGNIANEVSHLLPTPLIYVLTFKELL